MYIFRVKEPKIFRLVFVPELTERWESLAVVAGHAGQHRSLRRRGGGDTRGIVPERQTHRALKQDKS